MELILIIVVLVLLFGGGGGLVIEGGPGPRDRARTRNNGVDFAAR
jgi:hypothetical protein